MRSGVAIGCNGTRAVVAAFGILCGVTGIIAGCFEILQGDVATSGFEISTVGPEYSMADDYTYFAVTLIPNLLMTGIMAVVFSGLVILWSVRYAHRRNGALVLMGLLVAQTLVGGGWVIDLAILTGVLATRIGKPLDWWRMLLPGRARFWLARLFPFSLAAFAFTSAIMLVITVLGADDATLMGYMGVLAAAMFAPILLTILGGLAYDIQLRTAPEGLPCDPPQ